MTGVHCGSRALPLAVVGVSVSSASYLLLILPFGYSFWFCFQRFLGFSLAGGRQQRFLKLGMPELIGTADLAEHAAAAMRAAKNPSSCSTFIALPLLQLLRNFARRSSSASVSDSSWAKVFISTSGACQLRDSSISREERSEEHT